MLSYLIFISFQELHIVYNSYQPYIYYLDGRRSKLAFTSSSKRVNYSLRTCYRVEHRADISFPNWHDIPHYIGSSLIKTYWNSSLHLPGLIMDQLDHHIQVSSNNLYIWHVKLTYTRPYGHQKNINVYTFVRVCVCLLLLSSSIVTQAAPYVTQTLWDTEWSIVA